MASEFNSRSSHRHYDLSMSRRTRKPASSSSAPPHSQIEEKKESSDGVHRISLKELIIEDESNNATAYQSNGVGSTRAAEGDNKNLPVVVAEEAKTSSMVSHCVKVLKHLIRAKRTAPKTKKKNQKNVVPLLLR